jgi:hypothetical protein
VPGDIPQEYARFALPASNPNLPTGEHRFFKAVRAKRRADWQEATQRRAKKREQLREQQNDILKRAKKERRHLDDGERAHIEALNDFIYYIS